MLYGKNYSCPSYLPCEGRYHEPDNYYVYWYHPDHLGSSNYITNLDGNINQHMEYLPFGETLVEEHLNSYNSPYKFNAKEFDAETGWYYYGARYYNPKWSIWLSVDPLAEKYPSISPYAYVAQNPIKYIDPNGREIILSFASPSAREAYIKTANRALGGAYEVSISKAGKVSLVAIGNNVKLTAGQEAFYNSYSKAVTSEHTVQQTVVENEWEPYTGSWKDGTLDIGDIQQFDEGGEGGDTSAGALIHETIEQLEKAKMGLGNGEVGTIEYNENGNKIYVDYNKAHGIADEVQDKVQGNEVMINNRQGLDKTLLESDGSKTRQIIQLQENGKALNPIRVNKSKVD